jgi:hypothetical protein
MKTYKIKIPAKCKSIGQALDQLALGKDEFDKKNPKKFLKFSGAWSRGRDMVFEYKVLERKEDLEVEDES